MIRGVVAAIAASLMLVACGTYQQVAELDPATGLLPTEVKAQTIKSEPFDMDARKGLVVAEGENEFVVAQLQNIGFFNEVMNRKSLEAAIIKNDLTEKIPTVEGLIGLNNAAKQYKPFVFIDFDGRSEGANQYLQIVMTDAVTMEEIFRAERHLDTVWEGVNDRNTFYPLFNALIAYIDENSETYGE